MSDISAYSVLNFKYIVVTYFEAFKVNTSWENKENTW